jgi:DNA mismatch repair protein MutL
MHGSPQHHPIRLLPVVLRNQIAAGEVIDRPAGVLKELVENSLDAGATDIAVALEEGGLGLVAVWDNGSGIPAEELEAAVTRHATSKVAGFHDLLHVASYGFRGEALASIGSVSDMLLESACRRYGGTGENNPEDDAAWESGACIRVRHGAVSALAPSVINKGTKVEVRDLFANVPARLKFLKNPTSELKRCRELLLRPALAHIETTFSLHLSGTGSRRQELLRLPAGLSLQDRLMLIWPPQIVENLRSFSGEHNSIRIHGLMSLPHNSQVRGDRILIYVNGRPVANRILFQAVREAYKGRLTAREYPQVVLFLELDHGEVDVNVHPNKSEVRFREERGIFASVVKILGSSGALSGNAYRSAYETPDLSPGQCGPGSYDPKKYDREKYDPADNERLSTPETRVPGDGSPENYGTEGYAGKSRTDGEGYLLPPLYAASAGPADSEHSERRGPDGDGADPQGLKNYDTHGEDTLHPGRPPGFWGSLDSPRLVEMRSAETGREKPTFETRRQDRTQGDGGYPVIVGNLVCLGQVADTYLILVRGDVLLLVDQHAAHERILIHSFEREAGSGNSRLLMLPEKISLHPAEEERCRSLFSMLTRFGYDLELERGILYVRGTPPLLDAGEAAALLRDVLTERTDGMDDILQLMACRSAVKAGQTLTGDEAAELLKSWLDTPDCEFCPHGRPTVLEFAPEKLEKMFKRKIG